MQNTFTFRTHLWIIGIFYRLFCLCRRNLLHILHLLPIPLIFPFLPYSLLLEIPTFIHQHCPSVSGPPPRWRLPCEPCLQPLYVHTLSHYADTLSCYARNGLAGAYCSRTYTHPFAQLRAAVCWPSCCCSAVLTLGASCCVPDPFVCGIGGCQGVWCQSV